MSSQIPSPTSFIISSGHVASSDFEGTFPGSKHSQSLQAFVSTVSKQQSPLSN